MSSSSTRKRQREKSVKRRASADRASAASARPASNVYFGHLDDGPAADEFLRRMSAGGAEYAPIDLPGNITTNRKALPVLIAAILTEVERSGPLPRQSRCGRALVGLVELGHFDPADAELMLQPQG
jgi:hypothetical protein